MKKIDRSTILSICSGLLFIAGIIPSVAGSNYTVGFLFITVGFLFLTIAISFRRREDAKTEEKAEEDENK